VGVKANDEIPLLLIIFYLFRCKNRALVVLVSSLRPLSLLGGST
jgi:hypothetical protein